jgi:hypothetical protein
VSRPHKERVITNAAVALALAPQLIDEPVPVTCSDFTLDAVVSPSGIVWREGAKRE